MGSVEARWCTRNYDADWWEGDEVAGSCSDRQNWQTAVSPPGDDAMAAPGEEGRGKVMGRAGAAPGTAGREEWNS